MLQDIIDILGNFTFNNSDEIFSKGISYVVAGWILILFFTELFGLIRLLIKSIFTR